MASVLSQVFCCLRSRSGSSDEGRPDEHERLIPAVNDAPQTISDVVVVDRQNLKDRLGTIVRSKEGKMVNVNAHVPFNLHNQPTSHPFGSRSMSHRSHSGSLNQSRSTIASNHSASIYQHNDQYQYHSGPPSPSPQPSMSLSTQSIDVDEGPSLMRNPILNVRLVRSGSGTGAGLGTGRLTRGRGRTRGRSARDESSTGVNADMDGTEEEQESPDAPNKLSPVYSGDEEVGTTPTFTLSAAAESKVPVFKIEDAGSIARSWGD
ncbi:hypothetical protein PLICRDRAFT_172956 [Plicaturopsis crispa FD-325 SS-3]|nr:hypothetical protein PLICRDRAFT_172956 [Plicaturopsis crispa FD-325 SS-3]